MIDPAQCTERVPCQNGKLVTIWHGTENITIKIVYPSMRRSWALWSSVVIIIIQWNMMVKMTDYIPAIISVLF